MRSYDFMVSIINTTAVNNSTGQQLVSRMQRKRVHQWLPQINKDVKVVAFANVSEQVEYNVDSQQIVGSKPIQTAAPRKLTKDRVSFSLQQHYCLGSLGSKLVVYCSSFKQV